MQGHGPLSWSYVGYLFRRELQALRSWTVSWTVLIGCASVAFTVSSIRNEDGVVNAHQPVHSRTEKSEVILDATFGTCSAATQESVVANLKNRIVSLFPVMFSWLDFG